MAKKRFRKRRFRKQWFKGPKSKKTATLRLESYNDTRIGKSRFFQDQEFSVELPKDWRSSLNYFNVAPTESAERIETSAIANRSRPRQVRRMQSLAEICAHRASHSAKEIQIFHLASVPKWKNVWELVWNNILQQKQDTFEVFQLFSNFFGNEPKFKCHDLKTCDPRLKESALKFAKHRIEIVNVSDMKNDTVVNLVRYLAETLNTNTFYYYDASGTRCKLSVIKRYLTLNCEQATSASSEFFTSVVNIDNLISLTIRLDRESLALLLRAVKLGKKLQNLMMISIHGVFDQEMLLQLIKHCEKLVYIETKTAFTKQPELNSKFTHLFNLKRSDMIEKSDSHKLRQYFLQSTQNDILDEIFVGATAMLYDFKFSATNIQTPRLFSLIEIVSLELEVLDSLYKHFSKFGVWRSIRLARNAETIWVISSKFVSGNESKEKFKKFVAVLVQLSLLLSLLSMGSLSISIAIALVLI